MPNFISLASLLSPDIVQKLDVFLISEFLVKSLTNKNCLKIRCTTDIDQSWKLQREKLDAALTWPIMKVAARKEEGNRFILHPLLHPHLKTNLTQFRVRLQWWTPQLEKSIKEIFFRKNSIETFFRFSDMTYQAFSMELFLQKCNGLLTITEINLHHTR